MNVFGLPVKLQLLPAKNKLPLILTGDYDFYRGQILDQECLILHFKGEYLSIPRVQKHFEQIPDMLGIAAPCALWLDQINAVQRDRLIQSRIPFFVDEKIVFLPFLGTRLEALSTKVQKRIPEKFTTAEQCVFLWLLYQNTPECPIAPMKKDLRLSQATVARALLLFQQCGLLTSEGNATRKRYFRIERKQFWENGKKYLASPVQKRVFIEDAQKLPEIGIFDAGEEALAGMSMLQPPEYGYKAISKKDYDKLKSLVVESKDLLRSENYTVVEVWNYDPGMHAKIQGDHFKEYGNVDLFSLYLSFGSLLDDARIETAISNLMEDFFNDQRA